MGLFDSVMGAVTSQVQQQGGLTSVLVGLLGNGGELGGLKGLVEKFNQAGLGEVISSWIGKGENLPISAEQISNVLGSDIVRNIASQLGIDPAQAASQLSSLLPGLVDKLTPQGVVPEGGLDPSGDVLGLLGGLLPKF